jgi:hypothetical protein
MKTKSYGLLLAAVLAVAVAPIASAAVCATDTNVTVGSFSCTDDGLTFSNFTVSGSSGISSAIIGLTGETIVGDDVTLTFSIGGVTYTGGANLGDIDFQYIVTGGIVGIDVSATGSGETGNLTINETACTAAFTGESCDATQLANIQAISTGSNASASSTPFIDTSTVYINKDIQFNGLSTSGFNNSVVVGSSVPEPMTFSLLGAGLLGLGLLGRRRLRK